MYQTNGNKREPANLGTGNCSKAMLSLRSVSKGRRCKRLLIKSQNVRAQMRHWPEFTPHVVYLKSEGLSRKKFASYI